MTMNKNQKSLSIRRKKKLVSIKVDKSKEEGFAKVEKKFLNVNTVIFPKVDRGVENQKWIIYRIVLPSLIFKS